MDMIEDEEGTIRFIEQQGKYIGIGKLETLEEYVCLNLRICNYAEKMSVKFMNVMPFDEVSESIKTLRKNAKKYKPLTDKMGLLGQVVYEAMVLSTDKIEAMYHQKKKFS